MSRVAAPTFLQVKLPEKVKEDFTKVVKLSPDKDKNTPSKLIRHWIEEYINNKKGRPKLIELDYEVEPILTKKLSVRIDPELKGDFIQKTKENLIDYSVLVRGWINEFLQENKKS